MLYIPVNGHQAPAYLALPSSGRGPGVLVLHAWWGLNDFFKSLCDRLAAEGFVVLAPDLYDGRTGSTVEEAKQLISGIDFQETRARVLGAADHLSQLEATSGETIGVMGFSMGAAWALLASSLRPETISAVVTFYGSEAPDFTQAKAAYLGHFCPDDEWEPLEGVQQMEAAMRQAGREVSFHFYPGSGHWFFEDNQPEAYQPEAARLAWERTLEFLHARLGG